MACNEFVGRGVVSYPCTLPERHEGPHFSADSPSSVGERRRWEAENKKQEAAATLSQFQGPAQTTAERYTENPTPVPVSPGRARLHADCLPWECLVYDGGHGQRQNAKDECPIYDERVSPPVGDPEAGTEVGRQTRSGTVKEQVREGFEAPPHAAPLVSGPFPGAPQFDIPQPTTDPLTGQPLGECGAPDPEAPGEWCRRTKGHSGDHVTVPTKQRPGDQVLPTRNDYPDIQSGVIADLEARREVGIGRYGTALQPFNGRDTLVDAYEEAMDLTVYLKSLVVMKEALRPQLVEAVVRSLVQNSALPDWMQAPALGRDMTPLAEIAVDAILDAALLFQPGPA